MLPLSVVPMSSMPSRSAKVDSLAAKRYRLLVQQIRDELGAEYGWKEEAASRLGVTGAFVGMVEAGTRAAGGTSIEKARQRLKIHHDFFYDASLGTTPHYRDHIMVRPAPTSGPAEEPPFWLEFIERYEHLEELTEDDLAEIKRFAGRKLRIRSWTDWERVAEMVRTAKPSPTFDRTR